MRACACEGWRFKEMGKKTIRKVQTSLEGFVCKGVEVQSYSAVSESLTEWVDRTTDELLGSKKSEAAEIAYVLLREKFKDVEREVFFRIDGKCYFLDFYIPKRRVAIEIDGRQHISSREYDKKRDKAFHTIGIRTIRIYAREVMEGKMMEILMKLMWKDSSKKKKPKPKSKKKNKPTMSREERERNKLLRSAYKRLKEHNTNKHRSKWV